MLGIYSVFFCSGDFNLQSLITYRLDCRVHSFLLVNLYANDLNMHPIGCRYNKEFIHNRIAHHIKQSNGMKTCFAIKTT